MIITKKAFDAAIKEAQAEVERRFCEAREKQDVERWLDDRMNDMNRRMNDAFCDIDRRLRELEKRNENMNAVTCARY